MESFKLLVVKVIKRLGVLPLINFKLSKNYNKAKIEVPFISGMGLENYLLKKNWLDSLIYEFFNKDQGCFVDVGVNIGQTLIKLKTISSEKAAGGYLGFEPNPACVFYVNNMIKQNNWIDCEVKNCALTDSIQNLIFEKSSVSDSRASVVTSLRPGLFSEKEYVLGIDYDRLFEELPIAFLKIDVEGGELEVLRGMKKSLIKHQPIITCEILDSHSAEVFEFTQRRANSVTSFLKSINYCILKLFTNTHQILRYELVDGVILEQWTRQSSYQNDYLFVPSRSKNKSMTLLEKIIQE